MARTKALASAKSPPGPPRQRADEIVSEDHGWFASGVDEDKVRDLGFKVSGGGPHQSKTMMLAELSLLFRAGHGDDPGKAVLEENVLAKPSLRAREATLYRLNQLYGLGGQDPICVTLRRLWARDSKAQLTLALICALARDPAFRDGASAVLDAPLGQRVRWPAIVAAFEAAHPGRLGERMAKSLAQNAASSWTQAGFLAGAVKKERVRPHASPVAAAYAALVADLAGFGGTRLLTCRWLDLLDRPPEARLALLRQAEGMGLVRVRMAGDVMEVEARQPMAAALEVPAFVHG